LGLGCAVRFRFEAKQCENEAKHFSHQNEKIQFFACFALKRKTRNHKRNENERSEKAKRNGKEPKNEKYKNDIGEPT
jgi:hypothetical protein